MAGLELLGSGRDADVFSLGQDRVLRRYRDGWDATGEAEVIAYVAAQRHPVPTVYEVDGPDLVMELLDGPTMAHAWGPGTLDLSAGARILADLHDRLHALPAGSGGRAGSGAHPRTGLLDSERGRAAAGSDRPGR